MRGMPSYGRARQCTCCLLPQTAMHHMFVCVCTGRRWRAVHEPQRPGGAHSWAAGRRWRTGGAGYSAAHAGVGLWQGRGSQTWFRGGCVLLRGARKCAEEHVCTNAATHHACTHVHARMPTHTQPHILDPQALAASGASSTSAQLLLPAVLQLLGSYPAAAAAFSTAWRQLPLGCYLPWAPQMLASLGAEEGAVLQPVLEQLAARWAGGGRLAKCGEWVAEGLFCLWCCWERKVKGAPPTAPHPLHPLPLWLSQRSYPQRLYLPYQLSRGHWGPEATARGAQLEAALSPGAPALGELPAFAAALDATTYPEQR